MNDLEKPVALSVIALAVLMSPIFVLFGCTHPPNTEMRPQQSQLCSRVPGYSLAGWAAPSRNLLPQDIRKIETGMCKIGCYAFCQLLGDDNPLPTSTQKLIQNSQKGSRYHLVEFANKHKMSLEELQKRSCLILGGHHCLTFDDHLTGLLNSRLACRSGVQIGCDNYKELVAAHKEKRPAQIVHRKAGDRTFYPVPYRYQMCSQDSDCIIAKHPRCCFFRSAINKKYAQEFSIQSAKYWKLVIEKKAWYPNKCKCASPGTPVCVNRRCQK